ncbi:glycosyltransferase family 2 protein [Thermodesulfobacteriota bacterium]
MARNYTSFIMVKKNKNPLVSVIIPTYNRGWIIQEAIDSVLAQDFSDFELIVVDDGSDDQTEDILASYQKNIIVFRQYNQGVSAARNKGIAEAAGQFIAFLDSDDLWLPKKLSTQMDFFNSHPEALICQTEEIWIRNGIRVNPKKKHQKLSGMIFEPSLALCLVSPSAVIVKRGLFEEVGLFDEILPACEDYDLWLRVSCRFPIYLVNTPLIIKRGGHRDQLSSSPGLDEYRIKAIQKVIESKLLTEKQYRTALNTLREKCAVFANGCRKRGRAAEAAYYLKLTERLTSNN